MDPFYHDEWMEIWQGDCRAVLKHLPAESVHACVTSPPYYSLRDYGLEGTVWGGDPDHEHEWGESGRSSQRIRHGAAGGLHDGRDGYDAGTSKEIVQTGVSTGQYCECGAWFGQLGQEPSPQEFVDHLVEVFREVRRVLRPDGVLWLNLGDTYAAQRGGTEMPAETIAGGVGGKGDDESRRGRGKQYQAHRYASRIGLKHKDLIGIPWRTAFALQDDGWWLRSDVIWSKPNPMPESVNDRPSRSHEYMFMLTKSDKYFYDADAIREPHTEVTLNRIKYGLNQKHPDNIGVAMPPMQTTKVEGAEDFATATITKGVMGERFANPAGRNKRTVWTVSTVPYPGAHYAVFPMKLIEPCILASTSEKGVCPSCGAPWQRVTERIREPRGDSFGRKDVGPDDHGQAGSPFMEIVGIETIGWMPTCDHVVDGELRECPECGAPYVEIDAVDPWQALVDPSRPQSIRAVELAQQKGLTLAHIDALRAAGITDTGKAQQTQTGFGNNTEEVQRLALEAKEALGGYTREFTFVSPTTVGWRPTCEHEPVIAIPGVVLDPFAGSGTVGKVAQDNNRRAILIDLNPEYLAQQLSRNSQMPLGLVAGE